MKMISRVLMTAVAVAALAAPAMAAVGDTKLIVTDDAGTSNVFTVDNTGIMNSVKSGVGLSTGHTAEAQLHVVDTTGGAARGLMLGQHNTGTHAANIIFRKSRGTDLVPTAAASGDYIASFHANAYDGTKYLTTATVAMQVDAAGGPVSSTNLPISLMFMTGINGNGAADPGNKTDRFRLTFNGNVIAANKGGSATGNIAVTDTNGHFYVPTVAGAVTSCATMTTYTGHAPIWLDVTNFKVCSCISGALKCTAAMN